MVIVRYLIFNYNSKPLVFERSIQIIYELIFHKNWQL